MSASPDLPHQVFRLAVEQSALAISITDAKANILYANPAFERVTGYGEAEIVGQNESLLSYKVTPKLVYETLWAQLKRQRAWNGLLVNRRRDGSRYLAELTITPVVDGDGHTSHYLGMHRDVTEVHRLERQVQNQKAMIESVVDAAQVAICLLDENDRVVIDNQEYKKLIGDLGREPAATLLGLLREQMGEEFDSARARRRAIQQREVRVERPSRRPDQAARWFACAVSWVEEQDVSAEAFYEPVRRHYLLLTAQDISELKRQQEAIRINSLAVLLAEQERIQGLRETLAGAIFQLEGPLNTMTAAVRLLERRRGGEGGGGNGEEAIDTAMETALRDSRAALDTLRACMPNQTVEAIQPLNLNEVLRDVLKMSTAALLGAGVIVEWQPAPVLPAVPGGATQIAALFRQLLTNAIEAINERRASDPKKERVVRLSTLPYPDHVEVILEDSGPGIPAEWRYKVFEPFFTTKGADRQHLGMGLSMAQDTVVRHGGLIDIDPDFRAGCRVRVQLPCAKGG
ncbi:MAG: nitrogen fixation negative regulator NifL [Hydrogenophilales bacterium 28-61-23]|nr:MAG: nitrogen fixation negative regulator NifL [Hydrogenophilales bacterium 28-61-23]